MIVQPDILYTYILINGRLEASGMESVLVFSQSSHHNWCRDQDASLGGTVSELNLADDSRGEECGRSRVWMVR